ncbi:hypothetical protein R3I94_008699 [Phoxinus phoxinus]
MKKLRNKQ